MKPDLSWLPEGWKVFVGGILALALLLLMLAVIISAALWALGLVSGNAQLAARAKTNIIAAIIGAFVIGAVSVLVASTTGMFEQVSWTDPIVPVGTSSPTTP